MELTDAVEDLREDLGSEVACTEQLEQISEKFQQETGLKLSSLKQTFDSFSQQTLVRLDSLRAELQGELSQDVRDLTQTIEICRQQISDLLLNQDELGRRIERQSRQVLVQETLGERLSKETGEELGTVGLLQRSTDVLRGQVADAAARQRDMQEQVKLVETDLHAQDTDIRQLHKDTEHCLNYISAVREETAGLTTEMTENIRELRTQVQNMKWRQEDDTRSTETKVLECFGAITVSHNQQLERENGALTEGVSDLQGQVHELQEVVQRSSVDIGRSADQSSHVSQRLRSAELEIESLKRETQARIVELEQSVLRRSRS
jgi:chromosome segregation ATPase